MSIFYKLLLISGVTLSLCGCMHEPYTTGTIYSVPVYSSHSGTFYTVPASGRSSGTIYHSSTGNRGSTTYQVPSSRSGVTYHRATNNPPVTYQVPANSSNLEEATTSSHSGVIVHAPRP